MGHLIEHSTDDAAGKKLLDSESRLIIIAGRQVSKALLVSVLNPNPFSDTTSSALTILFVALALYPQYQEQLLQEVVLSTSEGNYSCGTPQAVLDSIVNEVLRLYNPTIFSPQR